MSSPSLRPVGTWLYVWCAMLVALVVIGGVTRLTESGLSITEWRPVTGILPPLSSAAWEEEFAKYQQIPEYREKNAGMTLPEFQRIFFWEYLHRLWARLLGLALAVPLAWFVVTRRVQGALARRLALILVLVGAQGALGWYMVRSGLVDRTDVSQYRLAAHLGLALLIYALALWTAADLRRAPGSAGEARLVRPGALFTGYVFLTILAGAFVAGLDAGHAWNTFPLMGGTFIPDGYGQLTPAWRNAFDNPAAVQFHHRWLGVGAGVGALLLATAARASGDGIVRRRGLLVGAVALFQAGLGVATLLLKVPIPVAALHQLGAVLLLTAALLFLHAARPQG